MHTHPTYTICMGACLPTDEVIFTRKLWKSNTEAVVVFPEGIGVLPCMVCGTNEIGEATADKMKEHRLVSWTNHGIYGSPRPFPTLKFYLMRSPQRLQQQPSCVSESFIKGQSLSSTVIKLGGTTG